MCRKAQREKQRALAEKPARGAAVAAAAAVAAGAAAALALPGIAAGVNGYLAVDHNCTDSPLETVVGAMMQPYLTYMAVLAAMYRPLRSSSG
jgi:hypothetical protein